MLHLPYMQRAMADTESRGAFATKFVELLNGEKHEEMCRLYDRLIEQWRRLRASNRGTEEDALLINNLNRLLSAISGKASIAGGAMYPYVVYRCIIGSELAYSDQRVLNTMMELIDGVDDIDECREFIEQNFDVTYCGYCDRWEFSDHITETYEGEYRCRYCIDNYHVYSDYHEQYIHQDNARWALDSEGHEVRIHGDSEDFEYDEERDMLVHVDYEPPEPTVLGNYHSSKNRQVPIRDDWSNELHRWLGVELEVEVREGDRNQKARELNDKINDGEVGKLVFFENDGSLTSGFEVITQPMSLPKHRELWSWLQDNSAVRGLRSHNTSTCGLHVHVNRDALSNIQVARIVTFVNDPRNEALIKAIARRYAEGYCKIKTKSLEDAAQSSDRYEAINITSQKTIEFRIFKGTLKYESLMAAVEFTNSMVEFSSKFRKADELTTDNFLNFINTDVYKETGYLRPYIEQRLELA